MLFPVIRVAFGLEGSITSNVGNELLQLLTYGLLRIFQDNSQASNRTRAELNYCIADTKLLAEIGKVDVDIVDGSLFVVILNAFTDLIVVVHNANTPISIALLIGSAACLTVNEKFVDWQNGKGHLLWCHGSGSVGKTFAFSRMADNLELLSQDETIGFAFFYCDYVKSSQQSLQQIVEAMTRQLLARRPKLVLDFTDRIEYRQAFLDDRKDLLKDIVRCYKKTFLVIDALDEFSDDELSPGRTTNALRLATELRD
ncbi:hypothetical protein KHU50_009867 [Colletotrichum sp. SAR 10_65]|nr:hypothetical protein KHU50_009867 [Colletotrichum sp. SAR 10_65]